MTYYSRTGALNILFLVLFVCLPKAALSDQWYIGPGITTLSLSPSDSSISVAAINSLAGSQSDGAPDVDAGSLTPTLTFGRVFGDKNQWSLETTLSLGFDEAFYANGQKFATAKILPINLFGAYQGNAYQLGTSQFSVRPLIGAGALYVVHTDTKIVSSQFQQFPGAELSLSSSLGVAALGGVNIGIKPKMSILLGFIYLAGVQTDVAIENFELPVPFVSTPSTINLGGTGLDGTAFTARLQYLF